MMINVNEMQKWCYFNLDLIEESLMSQKKAIVLISGASSSGKSYSSEILKNFLIEKGFSPLIIQTDNYNRGISGIIVNKVNQNFFNSTLPNIKEITKEVKDVIINSAFQDKFCDANLIKIKKACENLIENQHMNTFINALVTEFSKINFDEPTVYDLECIGKDINTLIKNETITKKEHTKVLSEQIPNDITFNGNDYNVIIVEGIYALNEQLINTLNTKNCIKNFILCSEKTLFLRRILRDSKITSLNNSFTVKNYFEYVFPNYKKLILPNKNITDIIFYNDMTFEELREGEIISKQQKVKLHSSSFALSLLNQASSVEKVYEKDFYIENKETRENEFDNILRLRMLSYDEGKTYKLGSLVHKGNVRLRKDSLICRPVNVLIKEGEFEKIYSSEHEFLNKLIENGFKVSKILTKERVKLKINNEKYTIDYIKGVGTFVEYSPENNYKIINLIQQNGKKCSSFYEKIANEIPVKA